MLLSECDRDIKDDFKIWTALAVIEIRPPHKCEVLATEKV